MTPTNPRDDELLQRIMANIVAAQRKSVLPTSNG